MSRQYVGHLSCQDPVHPYLVQDVLPQIGVRNSAAEFRVFSMKASKVYLYEERHSGAKVVGKFFLKRSHHADGGTQRMCQEFDNLQILRGYGLAGYPHHVVRPLGANASLNNILVEEFATGVPLGAFINEAIQYGHSQALFEKLTALAYFLATLHNRTANPASTVDFQQDCAYLDRLVQKLRVKQLIGGWDADELYWLRDLWRKKPRMWEDNEVFVHGDATPSNLLFGRGLSVIAIDLERMKRADRVFDLGRIAGELQHYFLQAGNKHSAEPFIGHFLWEYACHFPDRGRAFRSITGRLPFQMALTLLRIARNSWVSRPQCQRLVEEAKVTLRTP